MEFTKQYFDYRLKDKKLDLEREKFRHRCEQHIRREEQAKQRVAVAGDPKEPRAENPSRGSTKAA